MGSLKLIEMENFKSFKGKCVVGPFGNFTSIVGPNGSGKSNIMEAISFALGESYSNLRANRITDLIYRASARAPVSGSASVTLHVELDNQTVTKFTRIIGENLSRYKIDENVVRFEEYLRRLVDLKINPKAKHFLVYQGTIEDIATRNAKRRTHFFEQISGSIEFKGDYDRYWKESNEAKEDYLCVFDKHKKMTIEKNNLIREEKQASGADKLLNQMVPLKTRRALLKLWKCEKLYDQTSEKLNKFHRETRNFKNSGEALSVQIKETKNLQRKFVREDDKERFVKKKENELNQKKSEYASSREAATHAKAMIEKDKKQLEKAQKAQAEQRKIVEDLETQIRGLENEIIDLREEIREFEESQEFRLDDEQMDEYKRLKTRANDATIQNIRKRDECEKKRQKLAYELDNKNRKLIEIELRVKIKRDQIDSNTKNIENIDRNIKKMEDRIEWLSKRKRELEEERTSLKSRMDKEKELNDVISKIAGFKNSEEANSGFQKRQNVLQHLKSSFPGVKGRLRNLFKPKHKKYNIAVGKSTSSRHNSIVVDTQNTATQCIDFLEHQKLGVENFLPLDSIVVKEKPIPRVIDDSVERLLDVVEFSPELKPVIWLVTNKTLVCETSDEICEIARLSNYDVIALDGTSCLKTGIVSGGKANLENKWKDWNYKPEQSGAKSLEDLKRRKDELTAQLPKVGDLERKNFEVSSLEDAINSLKKQMTLADSQKNGYQEQNEKLDDEVNACEEQKRQIQNDIENLEKSFEAEESMMKREESLIIETVDEIFLDFCQRNDFENIRKYEKEVSRVCQEQKTKLSEIENHMNNVDYHLGRERKRSLKGEEKISKLQKCLEEHESQLLECLKTEETTKEDLDSLENEMRELTKKRQEKKIQFRTYSEDLRKMGKKLTEINREIQIRQNEITNLREDLIELRNERHEILALCKIENLGIKILDGSLDNVDKESSAESIVSSDGSSIQGEWKRKVDYSDVKRDFEKLTNEEDLNREMLKIDKDIEKLRDELKNVASASLKFKEKLKNLDREHRQLERELTDVKARVNQTKRLFAIAKNNRLGKFNLTFEHLRHVIGEIYKELTNDPRADAMFIASNEEEPYLGEIRYDCMLPGKNFREMKSLSGGERSLASLAILLALRSYQESPFIVLDEIDNSLDQINIRNVVNYFKNNAVNFQVVVISHKHSFYSAADTLFGIRSKRPNDDSTQAISLDLSEYLED